MNETETKQIVRLTTVFSGHLIDGTVTFSPAPREGVLSELATFEAQRIFSHVVKEEVDAGRL
jgi:hypothetical protein